MPVESYLLEYLANTGPASRYISTINYVTETEHTTTIDQDDNDGAPIDLFEFPTKVWAVIDADEREMEKANDFNKSKSGGGKVRAKLKTNSTRLRRT